MSSATIPIDPLERFLWAIAIFLLLECGFYFIRQAYKNENKKESFLLYGFASFFLAMGITRTFYYFMVYFFIPGSNYSFYIVSEAYTSSGLVLAISGHITFLIGATIFILSFEYLIDKTKYVMTGYLMLCIILTIINHLFFIAIVPTVILLIIVLFFWLSFRSKKEFETVSVFLIYGVMLLIMGDVFDLLARDLADFPLYLPPLFIIAGTLIIILPRYLNPTILTRSKLIWTIFIIANVIPLIKFLSFLLTPPEYSFEFFLGIGFGILLFGMIILFTILRLNQIFHENKLNRGNVKSLRDENEEVLVLFMKPQKITEEEVSISKEKKICLVCKSKIERFNVYLCPNCSTFYCEKCAHTLSNMENLCWVCDTPFDETKPFNKETYEPKDEIKIGKDILKNKSGPKKKDLKN